MKMNAYVAGVGMTRFAKMRGRSLKSIAGEAITAALTDAGLQKRDIQAAWMSNAAAGLLEGQEMIRGQVVLRDIGMGGLPVINVENACAGGATAFNQACAMVTAGLYDVVLACGSEKMYLEDKAKVFAVFEAGADVEHLPAIIRELEESARTSGATEAASAGGNSRSVFMDLYARLARDHMARYGSTAEQFAMVSAKNSFHGSLNPRAQFQNVMTVEEVLAAPVIAEPLTRPMCAPIGDGAAAVVIVSERKMREMGLTRPVRVASSVLRSGWDRDADSVGVAEAATREAYEDASVGPEDLSLVEMHDASAPAELMGYEYVGLCPKGEGGRLVADGETELGGRIPVNSSGGRLRMGHPLGATGIAQIIEVTEQLQGRSGKRQIANARIGLCHNGGGNIGIDPAAQTAAILTHA